MSACVMQRTLSPHDKLFKLSMQEKQVATDFFKQHLPVGIQKLLQFDTLHLEAESFIDQEQREHFSDVLYSVVIDDNPGYLFVLAEHQSTPDRFMPFRLWHYMCLIWDKHLKGERELSDGKNLPLIYPLVFYHGKQRPYPYSMDLLDCFGNRALAEQLLLGSFHLIDVTQIPDEELLKHGLSAPLELLQKHVFQRDIWRTLNIFFKEKLFQQLEIKLGSQYVFHVVKYVIEQTDLTNVATFLEQLIESLPNERDTIMTIADRLIDRGVQQGMQQGVLEGKLEVARSLAARGYDLSTIAEITGLSIDVLQAHLAS